MSVRFSDGSLKLDGWLLASIGVLLLIGLVMVASASMTVAQYQMGNSWYFFIRQFIFAIIALFAGAYILTVPTSRWERKATVWLVAGFVLLLLVLVPGIGHVVNCSRRWLRLGPIAIQV